MGEKPKRIPTTKDQRKPLLDAARAGKADLIDKALAGLLDGHIEDIRSLIGREWGHLLQDRIPGEGKTKAVLLAERLDAAQKTVASTHGAVAQASGVITPQSLVTPTNPEGIDYAALATRYETEIADLKAKLTKPSTAPATPTPAAQPQPTQAATLPHTNYAPPTANPGPSRGTRTTPVAPPKATTTHVAEGMRR